MLRLTALGETTAWIGERRVPPTATRLFPLLLFLAAEPGRWVPRTVLQSMLFPDSDDKSAGHCLRQIVYRLKQLGLSLESTPDAIRLPPLLVATDFSSLMDGTRPTPTELERLAIGFLPGFAPDLSEPYREWFDGWRARVVAAVLRTTSQLLADARRRAKWGDVERVAAACLGLDATHEEAIVARAEALALAGSKSEAIRVLERYVSDYCTTADEHRSIVTQFRDRLARPSGAGQLLHGRQPRLIGREAELAQLLDAYDRARGGAGTVILLWGDSGIGKTRLLETFGQAVHLRGGTFSRVECTPANATQPLRGLIAIATALLQLPGALGVAPDALATLRQLVTFGTEEPPGPSRDFSSTALALLDLVEAVGAERTLVFAVDDTHWIDEDSRGVIGVLAQARRIDRVVFVLSGRDRALAPSATAGATAIAAIKLKPLSVEAARELLTIQLEHDRTEYSVADREWMIACAGGNPLFLRLVGDHFRSVGSTGSVPPAISDLIERRLDGISNSAQIVLAACVLAGPNSSLARIERVVGLRQFDLISALHELEAAGLIAAGTTGLSVGHSAIADHVAAVLPPITKQHLHASIARTIWADFEGSSEAGLLWDCAEHWHRAGDFRSAINVLQACAQHSLRIGRAQDAVVALERAIELPCPDPTLEAKLRRDAASAADKAGHWERAAAHVERLPITDSQTSELTREAEMLQLNARRITHQLAAPCTDSPLAILRDETMTTSSRGRAAVFLFAQAEEYFDERLGQTVHSIASQLRGNDPETDAQLIKCDLVFHTCFGQLSTARDLAETANRVIRASDFAPHTDGLVLVVAYTLLRLGNTEEAARLLEDFLPSVRRRGMTAHELRACSWLAWFGVRRGELETAQKWHAASSRLHGEAPVPLLHYAVETELALFDKDPERAEAAIRRVATFAGVHTPRSWLDLHFYRMRIRLLAGRLTCSRDELETALEYHRRGRSFGEQDTALAGVVLALRARNKPVQAQALVREYLSRYRRDPFPIQCELSQALNNLEISPFAVGPTDRPMRAAHL